MPYFHVLAATGSEPDRMRCLAADLSRSELKKSIVRPYKCGHSLLLNGRIYPTAELRGIRIIKTTSDAELTLDGATYETNQELARMSNASHPGLFIAPFAGYGLDDIADFGETVTDEYIRRAPGEGGVLWRLRRFTDHPWITAIFVSALALVTTPLSSYVTEFFKSLWTR